MPLLVPGSHFGPYQIESRLGAGGMGVVYIATDTRLGRRVALKVVTGALADDPAFRVRFEREATTLARVNSPHIVSIFEAGEHAGASFIATQLVPGGDLGNLMADRGRLNPRDVLTVGAQLAHALADAHRAGVIHRDVKPANVLVHDADASPLFVYLCDFGIAQSDGEKLTATGAVSGSFGYIAPERIDGDPGSEAADIYSLGCVLWECCSGSPPYDGNILQLAQMHKSSPVPRVDGTDADTLRLNTIIQRCMAKSPTDRYASADDLRRALTGDSPPDAGVTRRAALPIDIDQVGVTPVSEKRGPRSAVLAVLVAVIALIVGTVAFLRFTGDDGGGGEIASGDGTQEDPDEDDDDTDDPRSLTPLTEADPVEIDRLLSAFAIASFPDDRASGTFDPEVGARSWSVEESNIGSGETGFSQRYLVTTEDRQQATFWSVRKAGGENFFRIDIKHPPSDAGNLYSVDCSLWQNPDTICEEITTESGRAALNIWWGENAEHLVVIEADLDAGLPEITVSESLTLDRTTAAELRDLVTRTTDELLAIGLSEAIQLPRPDPEPPLPSWEACSFLPTPPDGCPEGLSLHGG